MKQCYAGIFQVQECGVETVRLIIERLEAYGSDAIRNSSSRSRTRFRSSSSIGGFSFFLGLFRLSVINLFRRHEKTYGSRREFGPFSSPQVAQMFSPGT